MSRAKNPYWVACVWQTGWELAGAHGMREGLGLSSPPWGRPILRRVGLRTGHGGHPSDRRPAGPREERGGDAVRVRARAGKVRRPVSHKVVQINVDPREQEVELERTASTASPTPPSSQESIRRLPLCQAHVKHQVCTVLLGPVADRNGMCLIKQRPGGGRAQLSWGKGMSTGTYRENQKRQKGK